MKIKNDFVTNSSSASFILTITSAYDEIEIFNSTWNDYLREYMNDDYCEISKQIDNHKKFKKNFYESIKKKVDKIEKKIESKIEINNFEKKLYSEHKDDVLELPPDAELKIKSLGNMELKHLGEKTYQIIHWTSMYNSILMDIPRWMTYLIILYNMTPAFVFDHFGFKNVQFEIDEMEEEDC